MDGKTKSNEVLYSPSQWCKRMDPYIVVNKHIEKVKLISEQIKKSRYCKATNIRYGSGDQQLLDVYEDGLISSDCTFVYIHGGYWQELNKDISAYCVEPLVNAGIRVVVPGYDLAPKVTLFNIVEEIHQMLSYLKDSLKYKNIWLGGHSAGAHLAASMIHPEINENIGVKGFILISGIFDLSPLLETSINKLLKLNKNTCLELSPLKNLYGLDFTHITAQNCIKFFVAYGENDSPAFHFQSKQFAKFLEKLGLDVTEERINGVDHFDIVENLSSIDYSLTKRIINFILN
ncbi:kynurenine formamidase [Acyrthosiphon pisum]|uniref:Alpha/beta hydrolase fold-3 domain-containing protein n=1 Tax=Acyrthosiphon pisum TaxID=7029 RepID=A0A8R2F9V2_ACYPI|nr:kynurenine formamidase [Acyrthosiphon pisum]|eukprot:XP_008184915.1 PREDICTED: kynurenine formamidase [Acyrthosiphon pisum]